MLECMHDRYFESGYEREGFDYEYATYERDRGTTAGDLLNDDTTRSVVGDFWRIFKDNDSDGFRKKRRKCCVGPRLLACATRSMMHSRLM